MLQNTIYGFIDVANAKPHTPYVFPREMGKVSFTKAILHKYNLMGPPPPQRKLFRAAIEIGIDKERNAMWNESTTEKHARDTFPIASR